MKLKINKFSYLVEGLQILHNVGLMFGYFIQPDPKNINDVKTRSRSFTGDFGEGHQLFPLSSITEKPLRGSHNANWPAKGLDSYLHLMNPLLQAMGISVFDGNITASQLKELLIEIFLAMEEVHSRTFVTIGTKNKGKFSGLIDRFNETTFVDAERPLNASNIVTVARSGYLLYREALGDKTDFEKLIWSIALIGWASLALSETKKCEFCYRRTSPGGQYCAEHGQTDLSRVGRTRSAQANRYRVGKNAHAFAVQLELVKNPTVDKKMQKNALHQEKRKSDGDVVTRALWMSNILFPAYLTWDVLCDQHIRLVLQHSPLVLRLIGGDAVLERTYVEIIDILRTTLNLFEIEERALPYSVGSMEDWLKCEEQVKLGVRGFGKKACARIDEAIVLARQGRTRTEIARALEVGQSTVTLWVKKSRELSVELDNYEQQLGLQ